MVRGVSIGGSVLQDGIPNGVSLSGASFLDPVSYDRFEVIKGPEGSLYGSMAIGGIINRVTKQPMGVPIYDFSTMIVTSNGHQFSRSTADVTGPIDKAGKWRYRVVAADQLGKTWFDRNYKRDVFMPEFSFSPTENIKVWARFEFQDAMEANVAKSWVSNIRGQVDYFIPRDDVSADPWEGQRLWKQYWESGAEGRFFDGHLASRFIWRHNQDDRNHQRDLESTVGNVSFYDKAGNLIGTDQSTAVDFSNPSVFGSIIDKRQYAPETQYQNTTGFYWDNIINADVGPFKNKIIAYFSQNEFTTSDFRLISNVNTTPTFDYLHPVYYAVPTYTGALSVSVNTHGVGRAWDYGAQDNISTLNDHLIFVGGFRYDWTQSLAYSYTTGFFNPSKAEAHTYKVGAIVKPVNGISLYYTYSQTFQPQYGSYRLYPSLQTFPYQNQLGAMNEYGMKFDLLDSRLVVTTSYFNITLNNNTASGPTLNGVGTTILLGDETIRGWDWDSAFSPIPQLTLIYGMNFITAKTATGLYIQYIGEGFNATGLAKYTVANAGRLTGLAIGTGYQFVNQRVGDATDSFTLPPYGIWNAFLTYPVGKNWRFQLNVDNLADHIYAVTGVNNLLVYPGAPRTWKITADFRF